MNEREFDFESEFSTDDEVEAFLDSLVTTVENGDASQDSESASIVNPYRMQQILYTYKIMKYLTKGTSVKVDCVLHEPFQSMGYVTAVGKNIQLRNMEWFLKAVSLSSNFEVYPKTDGTVEMNFGFHGLTKRL